MPDSLYFLPFASTNLSTLIASLNLQQVVNNFISNIKETLANMVAQFLGGSSKSALLIKSETEAKLFAQLGDLAAQLGALTGNIIASIPNLGSILGKRGDLLGNLQGQIQSIIDALKPELTNIVNSILAQIGGVGNFSFIQFLTKIFDIFFKIRDSKVHKI